MSESVRWSGLGPQTLSEGTWSSVLQSAHDEASQGEGPVQQACLGYSTLCP